MKSLSPGWGIFSTEKQLLKLSYRKPPGLLRKSKWLLKNIEKRWIEIAQKEVEEIMEKVVTYAERS